MMGLEHCRCDIIQGLKQTNMSLHTELGVKGMADYIDAAPMALTEGLDDSEPPQSPPTPRPSVRQQFQFPQPLIAQLPVAAPLHD